MGLLDSQRSPGPFKVIWKGWESDTFTLHRHGWRIAVSYSPYNERYELLMRHEGMDLSATGSSYDMHRMHERGSWGREYEGSFNEPRFIVERVSNRLHVQVISCDARAVKNFKEIDATPQIMSTRDIAEFGIFPLRDKGEQLVVDKADMTVIEHLEAIKKLQAPKQAELREKAQGSKIELVANIVSYSRAA